MTSYQTGLLVILSINIVIAYGAYLPIAAGQMNLGIAGFMALGAYASAYVANNAGLPPIVTIFIGAGFAGLLALIVAVPILRTRGIYLALATFALGQIVAAAILNVELVGAAEGYSVLDHFGLATIAPITIATIAVVAYLNRTRFGLNLTAISQDELLANLFGVRTRRLQIAAFTLGAFFAGLGGALHAHYYNYIRPQDFNILLSIYIILFVLLGGTRSVLGPIVGAAIFTFLPEIFRDLDKKFSAFFDQVPDWLGQASAWRFAIFAALIIVFMMLRPQGIMTRGATRAAARWVAWCVRRLGFARSSGARP